MEHRLALLEAAVTALEARRFDDAWRCAKAALARDDIGLRYAFADLFHAAGEARATLDLLAAATDDVPSLVLRALARADLGAFGPAIEDLRAALAIDSAYGGAWTNLGVLHLTTGEVDAALVAHARALQCRPDDARFRVNRVVTLLRAGRMTEAWEDYEWRLRLPRPQPFPLALLMPSLSGTADLTGQTILVTHEEGFGDTLQFARYLPLLVARGAVVLVAVPPPLRRLLGTIPGIRLLEIDDVTAPEGWREVDHVCPFVSLPRVFGTTLATIPAAGCFAVATEEQQRWAARLPTAGCRVGLVWAGQARPWLPGFATLDGRRSLPLELLAPLGEIPRVQLISLQKGPAAADARHWPNLFDPMPEVTDFADTAAIIANLDLVVSVDTSVAHLAGTLGQKLFLLDRFDHCWRWLAGHDDSPWYPGLRIFRQTAMGDWSRPIQDIVAAVVACRDAMETVASDPP